MMLEKVIEIIIDQTCVLDTFHIKNTVFIIYLLEDEQELRLGMLICLQRIYNFWLFHAIILSILDVLYAFICYLYDFWD